MRRFGGVLFCIVPLLAALLIQIIVSFGGLMAAGIVKGIEMAARGETDPALIAEAVTSVLSGDIVIILTGLAAGLCVLVFGIWYQKAFPDLRRKKIKEVFTVKRVGYLVVMALGIQISTSICLVLVSMMKPQWFEGYDKLIESMGMGESWISFPVIVILAPIAEELIFRGVILQYTRKYMPFLAGNFLQAILFGVYHMNVIQGLYAFLFGLFLGLVCVKFGSVLGSILLHMLINLLGYGMSFVPDGVIWNYPAAVVVIFIISVSGVAFGAWKVYKEVTVQPCHS